MKKTAIAFIAVIAVFFGGCTFFQFSEETTAEESTDVNTTTIVVLLPEVTENPSSESVSTDIAEESTTEAETTALPEETTSEETTVREEKTTVNETPEEVDLSISMPEKNGTMETDDSPDNKFIKIVNKEKKINKALLLAVYSVPESGQNYVFEFYDDEDFSADNIRRVYLIDSYGDIVSVAATESSERVNISPVENWFCMNVLIKEIIYPAVSESQ